MVLQRLRKLHGLVHPDSKLRAPLVDPIDTIPITVSDSSNTFYSVLIFYVDVCIPKEESAKHVRTWFSLPWTRGSYKRSNFRMWDQCSGKKTDGTLLIDIKTIYCSTTCWFNRSSNCLISSERMEFCITPDEIWLSST